MVVCVLSHGGGLINAAKQFSIPIEQWIDLSTGINPNGWPVPAIPASSWARLPEQNDGLIEVAKNYYHCQSLLPVAGSQAAIQVLPMLRAPCKVAIPKLGYTEHRKAWEQQGHEVVGLDTQSIFEQVDRFDVVVLINPNNPTAELINKQDLLMLHKTLHKRAGWLIVDEAFMDVSSQQSLSDVSDQQGLFVLRSVGKFFGLAGIRAGFVLAEQSKLDQIEEQLGPWPVSGPTRWICKQALADHVWQASMRHQLVDQAQRLNQLISSRLNIAVQGTALFQTCYPPQAQTVYTQLAEQGILTRLLDQKDGVRFGLPADEAEFQRLEKALSYL